MHSNLADLRKDIYDRIQEGLDTLRMIDLFDEITQLLPEEVTVEFDDGLAAFQVVHEEDDWYEFFFQLVVEEHYPTGRILIQIHYHHGGDDSEHQSLELSFEDGTWTFESVLVGEHSVPSYDTALRSLECSANDRRELSGEVAFSLIPRLAEAYLRTLGV